MGALLTYCSRKGTKEVGSTEAFDHICEICANEEIEAVGYCRQCEQFLCQRCCQNHGKLVLSKHHILVSKPQFSDLQRSELLFLRHVVPISVYPIIQIQEVHLADIVSIRSITQMKRTETIVALAGNLYNNYKLFIIQKSGENRNYEVNLDVGMILCLSSATSKTNELLITVPDKHEVKKAGISSTNITTATHFKTSGECWGIAEFDSGFAVSVKCVTGYSLPDWQVQYLNFTGMIKKQIYYDGQGKALFSKPEFLASSPKQDLLYVSDGGKCAVIALNVLGEVVFTFKNDDLKSPKALTVDDEHNIYVACDDKVIQIHKDGVKHRVLIQTSEFSRHIWSVFFNSSTKTLITADSYKVKTFTFLP